MGRVGLQGMGDEATYPDPVPSAPSRRASALVAGLASGSLLLTGCAVRSLAPEPAASLAPAPAAAATGSPSTPASATGTPPDSVPAGASPDASTGVPTTATAISPFTGLPTEPDRPVLLVKMDNTPNAQPHAGLTQADLVYLEPVEYGMTRIAAVFSSTIPTRIGPVRSARITDIDLAAQFGRPALAFSGAQHRMYPVLEAAPIDLVSPTGKGFARDHDRPAPYNLFLNGNSALERATDASVAADIGLTFSPTPPPGGREATHARVVWPASAAIFDYDSTSGRYDIKLNGVVAASVEDPGAQHAASVIIQFVETPDSVFKDKGGGITPRAEVVGSGTGVILRDGLAYDVTWSRPTSGSRTTYTMANGQPVPLKPGQQWIALAGVDHRKKILASITAPTAPGSSASPGSTTAPGPSPSGPSPSGR